jgi:hypothetical protein
MENIELNERSCDLCQGSVLEPVFCYEHCAEIAGERLSWTVKNVVCSNCGFAFVSPVPPQTVIDSWFRNKVSTFGGSIVDYSISKRLALIRKYQTVCNGDTFVEIGSNDSPMFQAEIERNFKKSETVELNLNCKSTYNHIDQLPVNHADIIAAYFVVDNHINPHAFLERCRDALTPQGHLILEVPHLYFYSVNPSGLFSFEHFSHFSPRSLSCLGQKAGLELVEITQEFCSRNFGFAIVFRKETGARRPLHGDEVERIFARASLIEGKAKIDRFFTIQSKIRSRINAHGAKNEMVLIWGVNDVCKSLMRDYFPPQASTLVLDSDRQKKAEILPIPVQHPEDVSIAIFNEAKLLVLNTPRHQKEILEWIHVRTGRHFQPAEIEISSIELA